MGDLDTASTVSSRYLVELSALTLSGHDAVGNEMKAFAEQLKPYPCGVVCVCGPASRPLPTLKN